MNNKPKLSFTQDYFKPEVRENFCIEGLMKRAWAAQLEVLMIVDELCKKHNITWYADCGTLLGAIRHKGFVPWDDDVDIAMKRQDYEKFIKIAVQELPKEFDIISPENSLDTIFSFCRINNTGVVRFDDEFMERYHNFPYMAGIDISPLDGVPDDPEERMLLCDIVRVLVMTKDHMSEWDYKTQDNYYNLIEEACNVKLNRDSSLTVQLVELINIISQSYSVNECNQLANICWWATGVINEPVSVAVYSDVTYLPFENIDVPVPYEYTDAVKAIYGDDYMKPIRGTATHQYPFYQKQKRAIYRFHNNTDFEKRERWVAKKLGVNTSELFELSRLDKGEGITTYRYFCQGAFATIDVPETI